MQTAVDEMGVDVVREMHDVDIAVVVLVYDDSIMGQPTPLTVLQDSATTGFKGVTVPLVKSRLKAEG